MALNNDFKIKNNVNALGKILSGGTDLTFIFAPCAQKFTVTDGTTNFDIIRDQTITFNDGSGVDVVVNSTTKVVSITGIPATTSTIGVASFSAQNFAVEAPGRVYIKAGGVGTTELAGNIPDSKLATITTAGKVSNSATTATTQNTPSTIVLRGTQGEFSAGALTISGTISSSGDISTNGNTTIAGTLSSRGNVTTSGNLTVTGTISSNGSITTNSDATIGGTLSSAGNFTTSGNAIVGGNTTVTGTISSNGNISTNGNVSIAGTLSSRGNFTTSGNVTVLGAVSSNGNISTSGVFIDRGGSSDNWNSVFSTFQGQSASNTSVFTTFNTQSASNTSVFSSVNQLSATWNTGSGFQSQSANNLSVYATFQAQSASNTSVFNTVNAVSSITSNLTSDVNVGAITAAQVIPAGTTFQQFVQALLFQVFYPTFTAPSATLSHNLAGASLEVGFQGVTLTGALNRGAITGRTVNGVWQPSTNQDFRSGAVTNYTILGVNNGTTAAYTSAAALLADGTNTYSGVVSYAAGPQPYDSKFINFSTPLPLGSINVSTTATGVRRAFRLADTNNTVPTTSTQVRALSSATNTSILNPALNTIYSIAIPINAARVLFAYPDSMRDVTKIEYLETGNDNVTLQFTKTIVSVTGLNGNFPTNYKVYSYVPSTPFGAAATFNVTI